MMTVICDQETCRVSQMSVEGFISDAVLQYITKVDIWYRSKTNTLFKNSKKRVDKHIKVASVHPTSIMLFRLSNIVYPLVAIILLRIFTSIGIIVDLQVRFNTEYPFYTQPQKLGITSG
ncbi:MAG: hypothetical protein ACJAVX_000771 [Pseudoalteromonas rhizosphaerae]|jgi:hypothetical protein|uniref:hypothetical protein n=1 Tax=Pseudoalteromonas rhizosphaerae TaxID=2518973 RepID=UPI0037045090|tara:strand:- start:9452 stop:9808 length:357 start_codon:yes stop_codon:yes gene_type:complete